MHIECFAQLDAIPKDLIRNILTSHFSAGHKNCAELLIQAGAQIDILDVKAQTPLFVALVGQHWSVARALLEAGADPNGSLKNLCSPLSIMCQRGFLKGITLLCEFGADTEDSLRLLQGLPGLPIVSTATYHHLQCMLYLLLQRASTHISSPTLLTPLLHAIIKYRQVLMDCS